MKTGLRLGNLYSSLVYGSESCGVFSRSQDLSQPQVPLLQNDETVLDDL